MVKVFYPTDDISKVNEDDLKIFLAGTIDMGKSIDWQKKVINKFKKMPSTTDISFFNPRRPSKTGSTTPEFDLEEQIQWELAQLEKCNIIVMYLLGDSKSPISLLELGLYARSGKLVVICEPEYYRFKNVQVTCDYYNVPCLTSLKDFYKKLWEN